MPTSKESEQFSPFSGIKQRIMQKNAQVNAGNEAD
jgi:hypothetical protein